MIFLKNSKHFFSCSCNCNPPQKTTFLYIILSIYFIIFYLFFYVSCLSEFCKIVYRFPVVISLRSFFAITQFSSKEYPTKHVAVVNIAADYLVYYKINLNLN